MYSVTLKLILKLENSREVNPIFEGNQQQDAHELLVCVLDNIRESFQLLVKHRENQFGWKCASPSSTDVSSGRPDNGQLESNNAHLTKRGTRKSLKKKKGSVRASSANSIVGSLNGTNKSSSSTSTTLGVENGCVTPPNGDVNSLRLESNKCFISEDFEGVSLLRTTCLECEQVTERKETFCDICVPVDVDRFNEKGKLSCTSVFSNSFIICNVCYF